MAVRYSLLVLPFRSIATISRKSVSRVSTKSVDDKSDVTEKPKKPMSAFFKFLQEESPEIKKKQPDLAGKALVTAAAKIWAEMPDNEKLKYRMSCETDWCKYNELKKKYIISAIKSNDVSDISRKELQLHTLSLGKPSKPLSAFLLFLKHFRESEELPGSYVELIRTAKTRWNTLNNYEKEEYKAHFRKNMEKYQNDLLKWEEEMFQKGYNTLIRSSTLQKLEKESKLLNIE